MTIIEFLEARVSEDERAVAHRDDVPHSVHLWDVHGAYSPECPDCRGLPGKERTLAECAAKRAIIADHAEFVRAIEDLSAALPGNLNQDPDAPWRTSPYRHLAAIYKDHPDYQQEWALDTP